MFNSIGEASEILFGTMDNDGSQYYNERIKHFEQNSGSVTDLLKQQLYVVKSSLGAINGCLSCIVYNEAKMREGLLQVKDYIEKFVLKTGSVKNTLSMKITVESHIALVNDTLSSVQRAVNIVIDSIANVRRGILQPQVSLSAC